MSNRFRLPRSILALAAGCSVTLIALAQNKDSSSAPIAISSSRVAGTVVSKIDGHPLDRARVLLRNARDRQDLQAVVTSEDGQFAFESVRPGKYALEGEKRGFITAGFDQHDVFSTAIVTGAGLDTEHLILKIAPAALIQGTVLDESGDPVRHATISLYRNDHSGGGDQIHAFRNTQTDDLGAYEIEPLLPGTYFMAASAQPWYALHPASETEHPKSSEAAASTPNFDRTLDVAYPVTYYAGATESDSATPIQVRGGERLRIDFQLSPVPALSLLVRVPSDGTNGWVPPLLERPELEGVTGLQTSTRMLSPGLFEISGVPEGRYDIRFRQQDTGSQLGEIEISKDGQQIDASKAEALSSVKVSVQVSGVNTFPPGILVGLRSPSRNRMSWHPVDGKGIAEMRDVTSGTYELHVLGTGKLYSISSMLSQGAEAKGHTVTIAPGTAASISLTVAIGSVELQGTATRAGKGLAGAMVVLVPNKPVDNRDRFRRDQSDLDGTFSLHNVVPGSYTLLAIADGWDLDWSQPEVIKRYLKGGRPVEVVGTPARSLMVVKEGVDVQSK